MLWGVTSPWTIPCEYSSLSVANSCVSSDTMSSVECDLRVLCVNILSCFEVVIHDAIQVLIHGRHLVEGAAQIALLLRRHFQQLHHARYGVDLFGLGQLGAQGGIITILLARFVHDGDLTSILRGEEFELSITTILAESRGHPHITLQDLQASLTDRWLWLLLCIN